MGGAWRGGGGRRKAVPQLKFLILSGCHNLTDDGLR